MKKVQYIPVDEIHFKRGETFRASICTDALFADIKGVGILVPITVRRVKNGFYYVNHGLLRLLAYRRVRRADPRFSRYMPCVVE